MLRKTGLMLMMGVMFLALGVGAALAGDGSTITGTDQDDRLIGTNSDNRINAFDGKDFVMGMGGNDTINGGNNSDRLNGNWGNDTLIGGTNSDVLLGRVGNDTLNAADNQQDTLFCGLGTDRAIADAIDIVASDCENIRRVN